MDSSKVRRVYLDFFNEKKHQIVTSAPIVIKDDPTLMFTNAGMNQFKDLFLGNAEVKYSRIANSQKCLRVSGKHNDLEEVGVDTYHQTMFEMLGNWSFGDYFKKEAIEWAWELLTDVYKIDKNNLYVTVFEGDEKDQTVFDQEAYDIWKGLIDESRILKGNKKDNFWEMGETGPCGPCSEIHVDIRSEAEKKKVDGKKLVNADHPQVIEIWNLVFMEFNRKSDKSLELLKAKHVDTGMGFERLCMVLQGKQSNYDTDVFQPLIKHLEKASGKKYGTDQKTDIAMRVMADHIRAVAFAIADGQLPSNNKAGYVIRRILRRAARYAYTFLDFKEPILFQLVSILEKQMGEVFQELKQQKGLIEKVVKEEENSFLRTLGNGIQRFEEFVKKSKEKTIAGDFAFELYDTYGFPIDLTQLLAREQNLSVDMKAFDKALSAQKDRSKSDAKVEKGDWTGLMSDELEGNIEFVGYDNLEVKTRIIGYGKINKKGKDYLQIEVMKNPFYTESGGQVGDAGTLESVDGKVKMNILDAKNDQGKQIIITDFIPEDKGKPEDNEWIFKEYTAKVDAKKRQLTANNHSATHLMHAALRQVLGSHVEQKGSLVNDQYLRFDFSHFAKVSEEEIKKIESLVNEKIRQNISVKVEEMDIDAAKKKGAMALFGEKYGDKVRVVSMDKNYSIELCGGTHVAATGEIGLFKIISESAIAAGVRRIEAITAEEAQKFMEEQLQILENLKQLIKSKDLVKGVKELQDKNTELTKQVESMIAQQAGSLKDELKKKVIELNGVTFLAEKVTLDSSDAIKNLCFEMKQLYDNLFMVLGAEIKGKPSISVVLSEKLAKEKGWNAGNIVRDLAKEIDGGGGGQPFYATAGGKNASGLSNALAKAKTLLER